MMYNRRQLHRILKIGYIPLYHVLNYVRYTKSAAYFTHKDDKEIYDEVVEIDYDVGRPGLSIKFNMDWRIYYSPDVDIDDLDDEIITVELINYIVDNTNFGLYERRDDCFGYFNGEVLKFPSSDGFLLMHPKTETYELLIYALSRMYNGYGQHIDLEEGLNFIKRYKRYIRVKHYKLSWFERRDLFTWPVLLNDEGKRQYAMDNPTWIPDHSVPLTCSDLLMKKAICDGGNP